MNFYISFLAFFLSELIIPEPERKVNSLLLRHKNSVVFEHKPHFVPVENVQFQHIRNAKTHNCAKFWFAYTVFNVQEHNIKSSKNELFKKK